MTREKLLEKLNELRDDHDTESAHLEADELLLAYIADADVSSAFKRLRRWYA